MLAIRNFVMKFPTTCKEAFVRLKTDCSMTGKTLSEVLDTFMVDKMERQAEMGQYERGSRVVTPRTLP